MKTLIVLLLPFSIFAQNTRLEIEPFYSERHSIVTPFELDSNHTATYAEMMDYYNYLDIRFPELQLQKYGPTDAGYNLNLVVISKSKEFDPGTIHNSGKAIILINNNIHPGEPEGVDASMMLARNILTDKHINGLLDNVVVLIIPAYNIGGMLNRGCCSRANQNGPDEYGFRGNSKNLDLNRDFIKADSKEALEFAKLFRRWQPHVFIDNHTTNGADYQHVMTYIATNAAKLPIALGDYFHSEMIPGVKKLMEQQGFPLSPYVSGFSETPDSGIVDFPETPRYSTGYTALFNTLGFVAETHMWKPFPQRVQATYDFMESVITVMDRDHLKLIHLKKQADSITAAQKEFAIQYDLDTTKHSTILFKGYTAKHKESNLTGTQRLIYDRTAPWEGKIPFYNYYKEKETVAKPDAYIIPQGWTAVIERLKANNIQMSTLAKDTTLTVGMYYISDYQTVKNPYEGHYLHYNTSAKKEMRGVKFYKGDFIVYTNQPENKFILGTLEPGAPDSYFNWNFFDAVLSQKEYYSDYIFEDTAAALLAKNEMLKKAFELKKKIEPDFAKNPQLQLDFIYKNSPYYENTHKRYPVGLWMGKRLPHN